MTFLVLVQAGSPLCLSRIACSCVWLQKRRKSCQLLTLNSEALTLDGPWMLLVAHTIFPASFIFSLSFLKPPAPPSSFSLLAEPFFLFIEKIEGIRRWYHQHPAPGLPTVGGFGAGWWQCRSIPRAGCVASKGWGRAAIQWGSWAGVPRGDVNPVHPNG